MKSTTILELMIKDHAKLACHLTQIEKILEKDPKEALQEFDVFEWEFEKHIFTEEKAIFTSYDPDNVIQGYAMVPELIKEHNELMNQIRLMRRDLIKGTSVDFAKFKQAILKHKSFEEEQLYPKLDQELSDSQKKHIINRINQIVSTE